MSVNLLISTVAYCCYNVGGDTYRFVEPQYHGFSALLVD